MIDNRCVVAIVPARGGSKGIYHKNIAPCGGRPLIKWTLDAAHESELVDVVVTSTDCNKIQDACYGASFIRPAELATDDAPMEGVVLHALDEVADIFKGCDIGVLLQPTSPLRTTEDIDNVIRMFSDPNVNTVVSVYESWKCPFNGEDPPRRQDREPAMILNGAIYGFRIAWFRENLKFISDDTALYIMPENRSIDIDVMADIEIAEFLLLKQKAI